MEIQHYYETTIIQKKEKRLKYIIIVIEGVLLYVKIKCL